MKKSNKINWWKYIKPYLPYFILGPLCMIIEVVGEILMPRLLAYIINLGIDGKTDNMPQIILWLYNKIGNNAYFIVAVAIGMILTAILMMIGGVGGALIGANISKRIDNKGVEKVLKALLIVIIMIDFYNVLKFTIL